MNWTFRGTAYQTKRHYYAAIALEWLSAGGTNSRRFVRETFADATDDELADEAAETWELADEPPFERDGLTQAFAEYRHTVEASPVDGARTRTEPCNDRARSRSESFGIQ